MTQEIKTETNLKVTAADGSVKIETPAGKGTAKPGFNVFVTPDFVNEPIEGFIGFLKEYAVVGLAVGFAVGSQAQQVVKQILSSFIDPLFQLVFGKILSTRTFTLHFKGHAADFGWGGLLYSILNFLFVLAAIYTIIKVFKLDKLKAVAVTKKKKRDQVS